MKKSTLFFVLFALLYFAGCSSDNPTEPENDNNPPKIEFQKYSVPTHLQEVADNGNTAAATAVVMYELLASIQDYANMFSPPASMSKFSKSTTTFKDYTWQIGELNVKLSVEYDNDIVNMDLIYNGSDGVYTYNNFQAGEAMFLLDGSYGFIKLNSFGNSTALLDLSWEKQKNGDMYFDFNYLNSIKFNCLAGSPDQPIVFTLEVDGYSTDIKVFPDGSGEYTRFDDKGNVLESST